VIGAGQRKSENFEKKKTSIMLKTNPKPRNHKPVHFQLPSETPASRLNCEAVK
jgi:hypothetical protein